MNKQQIHTGFTLIELLVVIILLAILTSIAILRWPGSSINIDMQARQIINDIRYTQSLAFTKNTGYRINFLSTTTYSMTDTGGATVLHPTTNAAIVTLGQGITFGTFNNLPNSILSFNAQGIPCTDSAASVALTTTATIVLNAQGSTKTIAINANTGFASVL